MNWDEGANVDWLELAGLTLAGCWVLAALVVCVIWALLARWFKNTQARRERLVRKRYGRDWLAPRREL